jgi:hypothetical protein
MGRKKNPAAVALGKLAASKRTPEDLAEAGRRGGLNKAANRRNGIAQEPTALSDPGTTAEADHPKKGKAKK